MPTVLVHGTGDDLVPQEQSEQHAAAATAAGDQVELVVLQGDHFDHLDTTSRSWQAVVDSLPGLVS